jgi:hypothetical protein
LKDDLKVYPQRLRGGVEHEDEEVCDQFCTTAVLFSLETPFRNGAQSDEEGQPKRSEAADAEAQVRSLHVVESACPDVEAGFVNPDQSPDDTG